MDLEPGREPMPRGGWSARRLLPAPPIVRSRHGEELNLAFFAVCAGKLVRAWVPMTSEGLRIYSAMATGPATGEA